MGDLTKNISRKELRCKCLKCNCDTLDYETLKYVQECVDHFSKKFGLPVYIKINSAHRCERHNRNEGGAKKSQHLYGRAVDFYLYYIVEGREIRVPLSLIYRYLDSRFPNKFGIGYYSSFIHFDSRSYEAARKVSPEVKWRRI